MKVLIINQYAYAPFHHGGTRHFMLARELQRFGFDPLIVSTSFFHKSQQETRLAAGEAYRLESIDGVKFLWLRTPPYQGNGVARVRNMLAYAWFVSRRRGLPEDFDPDVIYSSSPQLFGSLAAQHLARRLGVPHVFEIRDLWPQTFVDLGHWRPGHPWIRMLDAIQKKLYREADHVVSTLPDAAEYIVEHGGDHDCITWITNGIDLHGVPQPSEVRPNPAPFVILHAGVHARSTGLDLALDAAAVLQRDGHGTTIALHFLGDGPERRRHERRVAQEGLGNVVFHDPVPKSEVPAWLAAADACLLLRETSPVHRWGISPHKLADYFAAGRPVVFCVDSPWNPVRDRQAGVDAIPGNAESLAAAMTRIAGTDEAERRAMARRGLDYLREEMDMQILGRKLATVLERVVAERTVTRTKNEVRP